MGFSCQRVFKSIWFPLRESPSLKSYLFSDCPPPPRFPPHHPSFGIEHTFDPLIIRGSKVCLIDHSGNLSLSLHVTWNTDFSSSSSVSPHSLWSSTRHFIYLPPLLIHLTLSLSLLLSSLWVSLFICLLFQWRVPLLDSGVASWMQVPLG